jgi:hypothetical protein
MSIINNEKSVQFRVFNSTGPQTVQDNCKVLTITIRFRNRTVVAYAFTAWTVFKNRKSNTSIFETVSLYTKVWNVQVL